MLPHFAETRAQPFPTLDASPLCASTIIEGASHYLHCKIAPTSFTLPLQQLLENIGLCSFDVGLAIERSVRGSLSDADDKLDGAIITAIVGKDKLHHRLNISMAMELTTPKPMKAAVFVW